MMQKLILLVGLVVGCHSLRLAERNVEQCPDVTQDKNSVLFWGMLLDGKDHPRGKDAYDYHGFETAYKALKFILTANPEQPLEYEHLMQARHICCDDPSGNGQGNFDFAETKNDLEPMIFRAYQCLGCDHMKALIAEVPEEFFHIKRANSTEAVLAKTDKTDKNHRQACPDIKSVRLHLRSKAETKQLYKELIAAYNSDVEKLTNKKDKLVRLATYLKDFAFLHPWGNGNGRFRTLQLIHEVRRLGLGCGVYMYNNNKDLYYMTKETYIQKIEEGIAMYKEAMETGKSPWLDADVIAKHKARFHPDITMPGLTDCLATDFNKGSFYKDEDYTEEELS